MPHILFFNEDKKRRLALVEEQDIAPEGCEGTTISPVYIYLRDDCSEKPTYSLYKKVTSDLKSRDNEAELTQPFFKAKQGYQLSEDEQLTKLDRTVLLQRIPGKDGYILYDEILKNIENKTKQLKILIQVGLSLLHNLQYIHAKEILHRDIKMENIIIYPYFNPRTNHIEYATKFIDFDLSRQYDDTTCSDRVGSEITSAPEARKIGGTQDYYSDIYSLGATLCELFKTDADPVLFDEYSGQYMHHEIEIARFFNVDEQALNQKQQQGMEGLKCMLAEMCAVEPEKRATLKQSIKEYHTAYQEIMSEPYKPLHKIKTYQTKLDKLLENITILTGLQAEPLFRSDDWQKLFDVYRYQINDYASINKVDRVITDKDENLKAHKQALLQTVNQFVQANLSQENIAKETGAANFKNLKAVCRLIYGLQKCKKQSMLQEKIGRIADSLEHTNPLRTHLLDWLEQHIDLKASFGVKM